MSKRDYRFFLKDIRDCCEKIMDYTKALSYEDFLHTPVIVDAVMRNLGIIGEAVKHLPATFRRKYPQIEFKKIAGLRDIVIHEYFGLDYEILWDVIQNKIPRLGREIVHVIELNDHSGA